MRLTPPPSARATCLELDARPHARACEGSRPRALRAAVYVGGCVATLWPPSVCAYARSRAPPSASVVEALAREASPKLALLLLFNAVNALICVWEIALWTHRANVQTLHRGYLKKFGNRVRDGEANGRADAEDARGTATFERDE